MARIPEEVIERLKQEVGVERLIAARGVELKRHGADLFGLCPFHDDRNPSLIVTPAKNVWRCAGKCNMGGSVIDWVMKVEGVSFRHAVELLRAQHPALFENAATVKVSTVRKLEAPIERDANDAAMLDQVVSYYHDTLKQSPEALKYLERRGLTDPEMIGRFRLGFANRTLGLRLPPKNRKAGAEMRARLEKLGVLRESSGHEHMNGSLVIPIFNRAGEVVQMYGRKITESLRPGTPLHLYLPGPHRGVWNEEALEASKEIILCEALIDALTFWCAGYRNVTASYGVNGFTDDHREAFRSYGVKRVYIAYDRDEAGDKAASALAEELMAAGIECFRVLFPKGMDANEYARTTQPAAKSLGVLLNGAQWLGKAAKEKTEPVLPLAAAPSSEPELKIEGEEIGVTMSGPNPRHWRVLGLYRNTSLGTMKVNVRVSGRNTRGEDVYHGDTLDLDLARHRATFAKQAAHELGAKEDAVQREVGRLWSLLEDLQREHLKKVLEPAREEATLSHAEKEAALDLLRDPRLLSRVLEDFERCGVVGEETNKTISYLAAVSRLLDKPLAIVVQSSSSAGKSSLMEAVLDFMPQEQREEYSAMTGQALFYMGQKNLRHKILAVSEEEGASRAAYALKLLQSEGVLRIASTGKDPVTGKLITHEYTVEGPVMIFLTTTAQEVDEELLNRSILLTVNEEREQTRAIHRRQRESRTLEGLWARRARERIVKLHRNAQSLLRPVAVVNNVMSEETFPDHATRTRRDHMKLLTLIEAIALLHQYQRRIKTETREGETLEYIEATVEDVKLARELMAKVLAPALDELPPQTRRLLAIIELMVNEESERLEIEAADYRFTRRMLREHTRWGDTQLRVHLRRLEEMEYLAVRRGGPGQTFVYQYDANCAGPEGNCAGDARPPRGAGFDVEAPAESAAWPDSARSAGNTDTGRETAPVVVTVKANGALHAGAM